MLHTRGISGSKNPKQKFHLLIKTKTIQSPLTACRFWRDGHDAHGLSLNVFAQRNDPRAVVLVGPQHCSQQPVCPVEVVAMHSQAEAVLRCGLHNHLDTVGHNVKLRCTEAKGNCTAWWTPQSPGHTVGHNVKLCCTEAKRKCAVWWTPQSPGHSGTWCQATLYRSLRKTVLHGELHNHMVNSTQSPEHTVGHNVKLRCTETKKNCAAWWTSQSHGHTVGHNVKLRCTETKKNCAAWWTSQSHGHTVGHNVKLRCTETKKNCAAWWTSQSHGHTVGHNVKLRCTEA